jgi:hypothetical protein
MTMIGASLTNIPPQSNPSKKGSNHWMTHASWLWAVIGLLILVVGQIIEIRVEGAASPVIPVIALLIFGVGLVVGVIGVVKPCSYDKNRISWSAIVGIALNCPLIVLAAYNLRFIAKYYTHLEPAIHSRSARLLRDDKLYFSIDIPQGFIEYPEGKQQLQNVEHSFIRRSEDRKTAYMIIVERVEKRLPRGKRLTRLDLPAAFNGEITQRSWRGLQVDVAIHEERDSSFITRIYEIRVPLRPEAIQLNVCVSGPEINRNKLDELATQVLASLDGKSNW